MSHQDLGIAELEKTVKGVVLIWELTEQYQ